jgi:hypothetical protein
LKPFTFKVKKDTKAIDEVTFYADTPEDAKTMADKWRKRMYPQSTGVARVKKF